MSKIIVADETPAAGEKVRQVLAPLGHHVVVCPDGEDARARVLSSRPDLLITDILLPHLSGFALCRAVRAEAALRDLPILVVTTLDRESDRYWGLKQGASEVLVKPVEPGVLIEAVRRCLGPAT